MQEILISMVEKFGYLGISLLIFIENIFPPIPSEVILLFGGFYSGKGHLNVWGVILFSTIGSMVGAVLLYYLGFILGKERLIKIASGRVGRMLHFGPEYIEKADSWFEKYGLKTVLICRCIPVLRSIVSIPAGIAKMKMRIFLLLTLIGSAVWNTVIVWLGYWAGDAWEKISNILGIYSDIILYILIAAVIIAFIVITVKRKKKTSL